MACHEATREHLREAAFVPQVVLDEKYLPDAADFRAFISRAKSLQTEAVVVILFPGALAAFAKQARALRLNADLAGYELFEDASEVKASQGALVGSWYVNADTAAAWFEKAYCQRYNEHPGWGAANAYDALKLTALAADRFNRNNDQIAGYLRTLRGYSGAAGTYSAAGNNRFNLAAAIKVVRENGFEKLRPPD